MKWRCREFVFDLARQGEVLGILNVTPDSFSDGGRYDSAAKAIKHGLALLAEGAAIIDIGGESTRPGAADVSVEEERSRVLPVVRGLREARPDVSLSIDTSKAQVAREVIAAGAAIINDVTGFRDAAMIDVAAETGAGLVVMHMQGTPRTMQSDPHYDDVIAEIRAFFQETHHRLLAAGVDAEAIVYDPGIGFGKTLEHNLEILRRLPELMIEDRPLLLGVSRKSWIAKLVGSTALADRDGPTIAMTAFARECGVPLHRVHEVKGNVEALRMMEAML
jgi:dihydropteroate synthase